MFMTQITFVLFYYVTNKYIVKLKCNYNLVAVK